MKKATLVLKKSTGSSKGRAASRRLPSPSPPPPPIVPDESEADEEEEEEADEEVVEEATTQTFYRFCDFPTELQRLIWEFYGRIHAKSTPNVIKIYKHRERVLAEGPLPRGINERKHLLGTIKSQAVSYKLPPIFHVCALSRATGKELYAKEFLTVPMGSDDNQVTYYNADKDIVVLENLSVFMEWRYNRKTNSEYNRLVLPNWTQAAQEAITRRIDVRHLVIGGLQDSSLMWRLLGRFYDCESIIVGTNIDIDAKDFDTSNLHNADRLSLLKCRSILWRNWERERAGPFVREDYRGKATRPVVAEPNWDPAECTGHNTVSNPILFFWKPENIFKNIVCITHSLRNFF